MRLLIIAKDARNFSKTPKIPNLVHFSWIMNGMDSLDAVFKNMQNVFYEFEIVLIRPVDMVWHVRSLLKVFRYSFEKSSKIRFFDHLTIWRSTEQYFKSSV